MKPPKRIPGQPDPQLKDFSIEKRHVYGNLDVRGKVEVSLPEAFADEYKVNNQATDDRENKRLRLEKWTFAFLVVVTIFSYIQSRQAINTANAAREANQIAKSNFRVDERPYLVQAPSGTPNELIIVPSGPDAGKIRFSLHLENIGKSPAIVNTKFFHAYIGDHEVSNIDSITVEKSSLVVPSGDKPVIYIFSRQLTPEEIRYIGSRITAFPLRMALYGHMEYTDIFPAPKPSYASGFCQEIASSAYDRNDFKECDGLQYIR